MSARIEQVGTRGARESAGGSRASVSAGAWGRAPFSLRCGAMLVDYTLLAGIVAFATIISRLIVSSSSGSKGDTILTVGYLIAAAVAGLDFLALPSLTGQTLGKWTTGLRIVRHADGRRPGPLRVLLRHTVGYLLSFLTLGSGFLISAFDAEGRALHDRIVRTAVVRSRASAGTLPR